MSSATEHAGPLLARLLARDELTLEAPAGREIVDGLLRILVRQGEAEGIRAFLEHASRSPSVDRGSITAWAALDRVEFYINNQPTLGTGPEDAARYIVCPDRVIRAGEPGWQQRDVNVAPAIEGAIRTDISVALTLPAVTGDTWVVAIARGTDGVSEPLFPVLPASLDRASNTTLDELIDGNLGEGGTPAFAFTNPLFIDVGGNGWTPPGIRGGNCPLPAG